MTKRSSFLNLQRWIDEVRRFTANVTWILIGKLIYIYNYFLKAHYHHRYSGNKCDMESLREVERAEAVAMAEVIPEILLVLETSAKENTNVEQCFVELATELKVIVVKYFVLQYVYYMIFLKFHSESTEWWWSCGFRTS